METGCFEFKSAIREDATLYDAYVQLTTRYRRDIPEMFKFNAFCFSKQFKALVDQTSVPRVCSSVQWDAISTGGDARGY